MASVPSASPEVPLPSVSNGPSRAGVLAELDKLLASASFRASPQLSRFLRYAVEYTLQGEGDQLKEYRLGVDVMGRPPSYDPHKDAIVRLEARRLRAKLREYYDDEGREHAVRIDIPKGGYAATFTANGHHELATPPPAEAVAQEEAPTLDKTGASTSLGAGSGWGSLKIAAATAVCIAVVLTGWAVVRGRGQSSHHGSVNVETMAVLPLQNLSGDSAREYLVDGITENLIDNLSRLPGLRVTATSTVFRYKGRESNPQAVGQSLHVNAVLTGKLVERADMIGVEMELLDSARGRRLWHGQYNRKLSDIRSLPEEISREVSREVRPRLAEVEKARLAARPTPNTDAYLLYLRGRYNWNKRTEEGFTKAIEYFNQAIDKDPNYALAYAGLADSYVLLAEYLVLPAAEVLPKAREAAQKAVQLDESLSEAHTSLAAVEADEWEWQASEKELRRAIELNPNYATAHLWLAELLSQEGRSDEAIAEIKSAQELEPLSLIVNAMAGKILLFAGQVDPAIELLQKTLEIEPNFSLANYHLGKAYLRKGMTIQAIGELQKSANLYKVSERDAALAYAYVKAGNIGEARRVLELYLQQSKRTYVSWYGIAFIYTGFGDKDQAFACLERAYQQRSVRLRDLKVEPFLENLRPDPRFASLVGRLHLQ